MRSAGYKRTNDEGGKGGNRFQDNLTEVERLTRVTVFAGNEVDAIQCTWTRTDGISETGTKHGGGGGTPHSFELEPGDHLVRVEGRYGSRIDQLTFITLKGKKYGPYGGSGGDKVFALDGGGSPINGFFGSSGNRLDAIGAFFVAPPAR